MMKLVKSGRIYATIAVTLLTGPIHHQEHCGVDNGVQIHGHVPNRDWNQHLRGKGPVHNGLDGIRHWRTKESRQQLL